MMELAIVCLVLLVVTVVGHLLWLAGAALCRLALGSGNGRRRVACRMCGQTIGQYPCNVCGYAPDAVSHGADRTAIAYEEAVRLTSEGRLDSQTFAKVRDAIYPQGVPQTGAEQVIRTLQQKRGMHPAGMAGPRPAMRVQPAPPPPPISRPLQEAVRWDNVPLASLATSAEAVGSSQPAQAAEVAHATARPMPPVPANASAAASASVAERMDGRDRLIEASAKPASVPPRAIPRAPVAPPPPHQTLSAFMETRNIRWGEMLGGLIIVGCAVALVITLWSKIEQYALLKFGVFTAVVAALFGVGLYAEHRWKLPTTSRGILLIGMLLVPLQFIAMAAMATGNGTEGGTILGETVSGAIVLWLAVLACRVLTPKWPVTIAAGFVAAAAGVFVIAQNSIAGASSRDVLGLGLPSLLVYLVAAGWLIRSSWKTAAWDSTQGAVTVQGMGLLFYATSAAMIFLLAHFGAAPELWRWASPLLMILAIPPMATGMLMSSRLTEPKAVNWRVTGTAIAVGAIGLVAVSVLCSWPEAEFFVPMAVAAACVVAGAALVFDMPWAHVPAGLLLGLASVVGVAWCRGELPAGTSAARVIESMLGSGTGMVLTVYAVLCSAIAGTLGQWKGKSHAMAWAIVAGASAAVSLAWVIFYTYAMGDPIRWSAAVFALYTVIAFAVHWRTRRVEAGIAAWVLFLPTLQRLTHNTPHPWVFAFLDVAALSLLTAIWLRPNKLWWQLSGRLAWRVCFIASICTALLAAAIMPEMTWSQEMLWFAALAAILFMATVLEPAGYVLAAGQVALAVCAVSAGMWYGELHPQVIVSAHWLSYGQYMAANSKIVINLPEMMRSGSPVLLALSLLGLAWTVLRIALQRASGKEPLLLRRLWSADRIITGLGMLALLVIMIAIPLSEGIFLELVDQPRLSLTADALQLGAEPASIAPAYANDPALRVAAMLAGVTSPLTWMVLAVLATWALLETWLTRRWQWLAVLFAAGLGACGLFAIGYEPWNASSSGLRWSLMTLMALGSVLLWFRGPLSELTRQCRVTRFADWDQTATRGLRACILLPTILGIVAITVAVAAIYTAQVASVNGTYCRIRPYLPLAPFGDGMFRSMSSNVSYLVPLTAVILVLLVHGIRERLTVLIFSAAAVMHLAVTVEYLLASPRGWFRIEVIELNAAAAAIFAVLWLVWETWRKHEEQAWPNVRIMAWIAAGLMTPTIVIHTLRIIVDGQSFFVYTQRVGHPAGWIALAGAATVFWWTNHQRITLRWLGPVTVAVISLLAISVASLFRSGSGRMLWLGFEVLLVGYALAGWFFLMLAEQILQANSGEAQLTEALPTNFAPAIDGPRILSYQSAPRPADPVALGQIEKRRRGIRGWIIAFAVVTGLLALRSLEAGPERPWWGIGGLFVINLLAIAIAWKHLRPGYLYPATAAFNLAVSIWWGWYQGTLSNHHWVADLLHLNMLCLAASGGVAMVLERAIFTPELQTGRLWRGRTPALPLQRFAGIALTFVGVISAAWVVINHGWLPAHQTMWLTWAATAATLALLVSLFWDKGSRLGLWLLYIADLSAVTMVAGSVGLRGPIVLYLMLLLWFAFSAACLYLSRHLRWVQHFGGEVSAEDLRQILGLNAIVLGIAVLGIPLAEVMEWSATGQVTAIARWMVLAYLIIAAFTVYVLLLAAVKPAKLALTLSDNLRMACVYAAEAMLAIAFLHLRLTLPQLFSGMLAMYWPMIVMVIAFAGVMASEVSRRQGMRVLAEPLEKTGALLPLLPVLGFFFSPSHVDFGGLLLSVGILYGMLAVLRKSFAFGLLAVLAANGALWHLLHARAGFGFTEHPQLWLIPLALSVLIAAYLNRRHLPPAQFALIRMACLMGVYISSTADIFINGVAQQPYLPLVLGGLSLAGALAGMWQRVRSMLYLGSGFLLLSIVTVIYHASVNLHQTWIIWLVGLACGAGLFAFFAVFEKKRTEVEALLGKLRQWEK